MPRSAKFYDALFWTCAALGASAILFSGCEALARASEVLNQPTDSGGTILTDGVSAVPEVVGNPFNFAAWGKITSVLVLGVSALCGVKIYKNRKSA